MIAPSSESLAAVADRFWSRVDFGDGSGCWLWQGAIDSWGYGLIKIEGASRRTHVVAWALANRRWPDTDGFPKEIVCHDCDEPACVRPDHIYLGTYRSNMRDRSRRERNRREAWDAMRAVRERPKGAHHV